MTERDKLIAQAEALEDLRELCVPWGTWERDSRQRIAELRALAASRVDLSGCEVKVPRVTMSLMPNVKYSGGYDAAIQSILDQMPQVKK